MMAPPGECKRCPTPIRATVRVALGGRIVALRGDPRVPETLYAALQGGAVYRTDDSGATWAFYGVPGSRKVTGLALEPDPAYSALRCHR